jgi:hypothetical protein
MRLVYHHRCINEHISFSFPRQVMDEGLGLQDLTPFSIVR